MRSPVIEDSEVHCEDLLANTITNTKAVEAFDEVEGYRLGNVEEEIVEKN
jgi:hypothetical protein